ncbi:MAG: hypothetical protein ACFFHD_00470 [Promethearchaeota archaeon]
MKRDIDFTIYENNRINNYILKDIDKIKKLILKIIPKTLTILLVGGFGRGEGSFFIKDGEYHPINDYDFIVIVKTINRKKKIKLAQISKFLANYLKIDFVDIILVSLNQLKKPNFQRTIFYYESLNGHLIIFDRINIEEKLIKINFSLIKSSEIHKLLFNRALCLLEARNRYLKNRVTEDNHEDYQYLIRQTSKAIIACSDTILLINGNFHYLYLERCKIFQHLPNISDDDKKLVKLATTIKLIPSKYKLIEDPIVYWKRAIRMFSKISRSFFSQYLRLPRNYSTWEFLNMYYKMFYSKVFFLFKKFEKIILHNFISYSFYKYLFWGFRIYDEISLSQLILIDNYDNKPLKKNICKILSNLLKVDSILNWEEYRKISINLWYKYKH